MAIPSTKRHLRSFACGPRAAISATSCPRTACPVSRSCRAGYQVRLLDWTGPAPWRIHRNVHDGEAAPAVALKRDDAFSRADAAVIRAINRSHRTMEIGASSLQCAQHRAGDPRSANAWLSLLTNPPLDGAPWPAGTIESPAWVRPSAVHDDDGFLCWRFHLAPDPGVKKSLLIDHTRDIDVCNLSSGSSARSIKGSHG